MLGYGVQKNFRAKSILQSRIKIQSDLSEIKVIHTHEKERKREILPPHCRQLLPFTLFSFPFHLL